MAAKFDTSEDAVARERHRDIFTPRPRSRPQGGFSRYFQRQHAREGFLQRQQRAAITAARRDAQEAKVKANDLEEKTKTLEATLARVAPLLPTLRRMQRRESAAATKIQAALQGFAIRRKCGQERARLVRLVESPVFLSAVKHLRRFFGRTRDFFAGWRYWALHIIPWERTHMRRRGELQLCSLCVYHGQRLMGGHGECYSCQGLRFMHNARGPYTRDHYLALYEVVEWHGGRQIDLGYCRYWWEDSLVLRNKNSDRGGEC